MKTARPAAIRKFTASLALTLTAIAAVVFVSGELFGGRGVAAAVVISILWLAWRFDNDTGSVFLLVVLLLIALGVIALLMALLAVVFGAVG